jgi:subtilisin
VIDVIPDRPLSSHQGKGKPGGGGGGGNPQVVPAGVSRVGAPTSTSNGDGVGIAVLDTGVDLLHADLQGTVDAFSAMGIYANYPNYPSCQDDNGHGTHVAGTIAARDNSSDVIGVAPKATLYCVKVLDYSGNGTDSTIMAGLEWVLDYHTSYSSPSPTPNIMVVNMSLGRRGTVDDNPALHDLITRVVSANITVVVSAGNDPNIDISQEIPAAYPEVFAVASTTALTGSSPCRSSSAPSLNSTSPIPADTASFFTTDGVGVAISAPGEDHEDVITVNKVCGVNPVGILSTRLGGGTTLMSGTSVAAAHVAGVVARYYQENSLYSPANIGLALTSNAFGKGSGHIPLASPSVFYTFDGEWEGIAQAP